MNLAIDLLRCEDGQDLVEYALLTSLLSVVSILALQSLGGDIVVIWRELAHALGAFRV